MKKTENNKSWWGCREIGMLIHCWWECKVVQLLWETVSVPQEVKHTVITWLSTSIPRHKPRRIENRCSNKNLYMNINSSIIYNIQNVETSPHVHQLMNGLKNAIYPHKGLFNYLAIKRNKVLIHATPWMNLNNIMLS